MTEREGVPSALPSGTVTFLFSDIEGSTQRWAAHRAAMQDAVRLHDRVLRDAIATNGGHVFKTVGDSFCAAFSVPDSAVRAALDAQRALGATDFSEVGGLRVRMAIHTGTADERDGDYFGPTLNRVARLLALGHGGQVLLSGVAAELVRQNLPPGATLADLGEHALKDHERAERVYQLAGPGLQHEFPAVRSPKALQPWLVPETMLTRYFTGRDDLLARLRKQLQERHRAALSGLGGVGKTQTAIEYATRNRSEYPNGVFWVNAETIGGLTSGFAEIARILQLPAADSSDLDQAVRAVTEWLDRTDGWLLILDNVDHRRDVQRFCPVRGTGDLLITSRESVFSELGIPRALEVGELDDDAATQFLLARTGRDPSDPADRAAAAELAAELGRLPLALEQAAAYIAETNAFSAYLSAFRKRRVTLLEKAAGLVAHDTVAVTWDANFEAVEAVSPAAADVLRVSALLAPDAIPFELLLDGAQALGEPIANALVESDDLAVAELLRPLARYSLVRSDPGSSTFSVHRLVQEMVWTAIAESERRSYVDRAVCALDSAFPEVSFPTWSRCERLLPHVVSVARRLDECEVRSGAVGRLFSRAGRYLTERGRYAEAQALHTRALHVREGAYGPDHLDVATSLNDLAIAHWYQGQYAEAQPLNERALAIRERALASDHPDVANSLTLKAMLSAGQGKFADVQPLYERALAIRERALGPDHPSVARSLSNLANFYVSQGRYAEAPALYERALSIWKRALDPEDPDVAAGMDNLARAYARQGRYAEAEPLSRQALAIRERTLGPDHPDLRFSLNNLADLYAEVGKYAEAEALYERALAILERTLGSHHHSVAVTLASIAGLRVPQDRLDDAEELYERALAIHERSVGPDHEEAANSLIGFASLRAQQGRTAQAISLYERALAIKGRTFSADHPELADIRREIDQLYSSQH
jgi:class 3 adenylate cyclase/tetratricopeptide (TPR) repeat protein